MGNTDICNIIMLLYIMYNYKDFHKPQVHHRQGEEWLVARNTQMKRHSCCIRDFWRCY